MSKTYLFYATRNDLLVVTTRVEALSPLKYVRSGTTIKLPPGSFDSALDIPNLGKASRPSSIACETYLVCDPATAIRPRQLKTLTDLSVNRPTITLAGREFAIDRRHLQTHVGPARFAIDQLANPDTIGFTPGGEWNNNILLHGRFATASESRFSQELLMRCGAALQKEFTRVKAFYVGPEAMEFLKSGKRLTVAEQSPPEVDLSLT
jgi:hypothetical protein